MDAKFVSAMDTGSSQMETGKLASGRDSDA